MTRNNVPRLPKGDPDGQRLQRLIQRRRRELGLIPGRRRQPVILSPELLSFILGKLL